MDDISSYFKNSSESSGKFSLEYSISMGKPCEIYINLYIWFMLMNFLCLLQRNTLGLWLLKILAWLIPLDQLSGVLFVHLFFM
jgi:hypothetical protein